MVTVERDELICAGLAGEVTIGRDRWGVAHIAAGNETDAWFGQGFAAAQDRLWQMEYDRRRAAGRWAQAAGRAGLAADLMARRLDIARAAQSDLEAMDAGTREMFEAYARGVNAFLASGAPLPPEFGLTGIRPEPWEAWHSIALFKIRHVLMGQWQWKMAAGGLLARVGPKTWANLHFLSPVGTSVILPPGGAVKELFEHANEEIAAAAEHLGFLSEIEAGSNSWAVHGSRTTTGKPVVCNDSHRALDVPNAYWQVQVRCPEFDVSGATFAGFPGFPHFGFNGAVAWNITHTQADYQDLYLEKFEGRDAERYLSVDGWREPERRIETIQVRGWDAVTIDCWRTAHGPVVHGDPRGGIAIALKYTALERAKPAFNGVRAMARAKDIHQLFAAQETWVDPVNNLVAADTSGNIGYLVRGELPIRASKAGRRIPVPGWTGEHEWMGTVPFERLPRSVNPPEGFIATANQRVIAGDEPYISAYFAPPGRADRLVELMGTGERLAPETIASWQGDTTSKPARTWARFLAGQGPFEGDAERARTLLAGWDGNLRATGGEGLLYAYFRRNVARELFAPVVGEKTWAWLTSERHPGLGRVVSGLLAEVVAHLDEHMKLPGGRGWGQVLRAALEGAWVSAVALGGTNPAAWRWDAKHATGSLHPLSAEFPEAGLDPPRAPLGGDGDTIQAAGYGISGKNDFVISVTSVYRQVVDFADLEAASCVIPGGVSGDPRSPHFADQLPMWQRHERIPMARGRDTWRDEGGTALTLRP